MLAGISHFDLDMQVYMPCFWNGSSTEFLAFNKILMEVTEQQTGPLGSKSPAATSISSIT